MTFFRSSVLLALTLTGCTALDEGGVESNAAIVEAGKADDYRSPFGQEYDASATVLFDLGSNAVDGDAGAEATRVIERLTRALDTELKRVWPDARRTSEANIVVMLRSASSGFGEPQSQGEGFYSVDFRAELGAPRDFLTTYPVRNENGRSYIDLDIDVAGAQQRVAVEIATSAMSENAYPNYLEMFEGGLDIAFHVGGDYNVPRTDVSYARSIYDDLVQFGFRSPVSSFDELGLASGPLTSTLSTAQGYIPVRISIYHPEMVPDARLSELVDAYRASARSADIVIYSGHAGTDPSYSGVVVHYEPRVALTANELANIELPSKYQIFVFNGCETYTGYADAIYRNPAKTTANLDVVTTVNYTWSGMSDAGFLRGLVRTHNHGWFPMSWDALLSEMESRRGSTTGSTLYGVHGIDDNARLTPTADVATIGAACTMDTECPGVDNLCVTVAPNVRQCGAVCTADSGCPDGTGCYGITSPTFGAMRHCLPH